ncbi:MAG: homocysteine S-methyltransferase family protein [Candidatus Moduliflexus flocculans]|nr:homocysteine S-methyltransferase family protein [Candidatus Moduliflexus flocculans]
MVVAARGHASTGFRVPAAGRAAAAVPGGLLQDRGGGRRRGRFLRRHAWATGDGPRRASCSAPTATSDYLELHGLRRRVRPTRWPSTGTSGCARSSGIGARRTDGRPAVRRRRTSGARYGFGYPACPDLAAHRAALRAAGAGGASALPLTEIVRNGARADAPSRARRAPSAGRSTSRSEGARHGRQATGVRGASARAAAGVRRRDGHDALPRGVFVNTCYDEVCLTQPALVPALHREPTSQAGAEVLETNSFGANRCGCGPTGSRNARRRSTAPRCGWRARPRGTRSTSPARSARAPRPGRSRRRRRAQALEAALRGADRRARSRPASTWCCSRPSPRLEELLLAARVAARHGAPGRRLASRRRATGRTADGTDADGAWRRTATPSPGSRRWASTAAPALPHAYEQLCGACWPCAQAGDGDAQRRACRRRCRAGSIYVTTPEYFAEYAKRYVKLGRAGVGGCCGTTPEHIRDAGPGPAGLLARSSGVAVATAPAERPQAPRRGDRDAPRREVAPGDRCSRPASSSRPGRAAAAARRVDRSRAAEEGAAAAPTPGSTRSTSPTARGPSARMSAHGRWPCSSSARSASRPCCTTPAATGTSSACSRTCSAAYALGLRNILGITGDPPKLGDYPDATAVFDVDAIGLTQHGDHLNRGCDLAGNPVDPPTALHLGVGADPGAPRPRAREVRTALRQKVAAGAEFVMTQPVFRPAGRCCASSTTRPPFLDGVPVLAGVWPLVSYRNAEFLQQRGAGGRHPAGGPGADGQGRHGRRGETRRGSRSPARRSPRSAPACRGSRSARRGLVSLALATLVGLLPGVSLRALAPRSARSARTRTAVADQVRAVDGDPGEVVPAAVAQHERHHGGDARVPEPEPLVGLRGPRGDLVAAPAVLRAALARGAPAGLGEEHRQVGATERRQLRLEEPQAGLRPVVGHEEAPAEALGRVAVGGEAVEARGEVGHAAGGGDHLAQEVEGGDAAFPAVAAALAAPGGAGGEAAVEHLDPRVAHPVQRVGDVAQQRGVLVRGLLVAEPVARHRARGTGPLVAEVRLVVDLDPDRPAVAAAAGRRRRAGRPRPGRRSGGSSRRRRRRCARRCRPTGDRCGPPAPGRARRPGGPPRPRIRRVRRYRGSRRGRSA